MLEYIAALTFDASVSIAYIDTAAAPATSTEEGRVEVYCFITSILGRIYWSGGNNKSA